MKLGTYVEEDVPKTDILLKLCFNFTTKLWSFKLQICIRTI